MIDITNVKYKLLGKGIMNAKIPVKDNVFISLSYSLSTSMFMSVGSKECPQGAILFKDNNIEDLYMFDGTNNTKQCDTNDDVQELYDIACKLEPSHIIYVYDDNSKGVDWHPRFIVDINTEDYNNKMSYLEDIYGYDYIKIEQISEN